MRLYFCSDIHGSEVCWRKFLSAPGFYQADVIVVGGDITGKFIVPIVQSSSGHAEATFLGVRRTTSTQAELDRLKRWIGDAGQYPYETTLEERDALAADDVARQTLFERLVEERVAAWLELAETKLRGTGVRCLVSAGNDDFFAIDEKLAASSVVEDPNGRRIELDGGIEVIGMGYGNPTPWACPRDVSEAELGDRLTALADELRDPGRAIFDVHVPPYDSGLDNAPQLDGDLRMKVGASGLEMIPVGSTAVRDSIERYRPMLSLHGHIHESRGVRRIGPTTVVNPGSEYAEGILTGAVVDLDARAHRPSPRAQLVSG